MNSLFDVEPALSLVDDIKIPPQPEILAMAYREVRKDNPDLAIIAGAIRKDVCMAGTVLKVVNSPLFGRRSGIRSIEQAIALLGMDILVNIIAGIEIRRSLENCSNLSMPRFWDTATMVAELCASLATDLGRAAPDEAYTVGLFHDCGIPILACKYPEYKSILQEANASTGEAITAVEERHLGTNHAVVGYLVTRSWGLPQPVRETVLMHHDVEEVIGLDKKGGTETGMLLALLKIAEHSVNLSKGRVDNEWARIETLIPDYLGLSMPDFEDLQDRVSDLVAAA